MSKRSLGRLVCATHRDEKGLLFRVDGEVELLVDVDALLKALGGRALRSACGRATLVDGAVVVQTVRRRSTEVPRESAVMPHLVLGIDTTR
jgi:hypothetical protein